MFEEYQHSAIQTTKNSCLDTVFHNPNKWPTALRKTTKPAKLKRLWLADIQTVIRTSRRLDLFLYEAAQNFEVFSNIQN
jgi:hypothetical protein